jgi:hypothetical protein
MKYKKIETINIYCSWVLMAHASNPTYLGDRDQEDRSLKTVQANSS